MTPAGRDERGGEGPRGRVGIPKLCRRLECCPIMASRSEDLPAAQQGECAASTSDAHAASGRPQTGRRIKDFYLGTVWNKVVRGPRQAGGRHHAPVRQLREKLGTTA